MIKLLNHYFLINYHEELTIIILIAFEDAVIL